MYQPNDGSLVCEAQRDPGPQAEPWSSLPKTLAAGRVSPRERILRAFEEAESGGNPPPTVRELAQTLEVAISTVHQHLQILATSGDLIRPGKGCRSYQLGPERRHTLARAAFERWWSDTLGQIGAGPSEKSVAYLGWMCGQGLAG